MFTREVKVIKSYVKCFNKKNSSWQTEKKSGASPAHLAVVCGIVNWATVSLYLLFSDTGPTNRPTER